MEIELPGPPTGELGPNPGKSEDSGEYPPDYCPCGAKKSVCGGYETFCWSCNRHEEQPESAFIVCFECNHVYLTPKALEDEYEAACGIRRPASEILFCQMCIHDF